MGDIQTPDIESVDYDSDSTLVASGDTQAPDIEPNEYDSTLLIAGDTQTPVFESYYSERVNQVGVALAVLAQAVATPQLVPDKLCTTDLQDELVQTLLNDCQTMTNMPITVFPVPCKLMDNISIVSEISYTYFSVNAIQGVQRFEPLSTLSATFLEDERKRRAISEYSNTTWDLFDKYSQLTSRIDRNGTADPGGVSLELCHHLAALIEHLSKQSDQPACKWAVLRLRAGFLKACDCDLTEKAWVGSLWSRDLLTASQAEMKSVTEAFKAWHNESRASEEAHTQEKVKKLGMTIGLISLACSVAFVTYCQTH